MSAQDPGDSDGADLADAGASLPSIAHEPFFTALANLEGREDSAEWRATVAGLVTLRLVDRLIARPASWHDSDESALPAEVISAAQRAADSVDVENLAAAPLQDLLHTIRGRDPVRLARSLLSYARSLEDDSRWSLAADAYITIVNLAANPLMTDVAALQGIVPAAFDRIGYCRRRAGDIDGARSAYVAARATARVRRDYASELRVRISEANIFIQAGDLSAAAEALDAVIADAIAWPTSLPAPKAGVESRSTSAVDPLYAAEDVMALARHDRGVVASRQQDSALALEHYFAAWRAYRDPTRRERVWLDLAKTLVDLGLRDAARDAFQALFATARQRELRHMAAVNLLELAILDGRAPDFQLYRRTLADAALEGTLSAPLAAAVALYEGYGEQRFGRPTYAAACFERAMTLAARAQDADVANRARDAFMSTRIEAAAAPAHRVSATPTSPAIERITRTVRRVRRRAERLAL